MTGISNIDVSSTTWLETVMLINIVGFTKTLIIDYSNFIMTVYPFKIDLYWGDILLRRLKWFEPSGYSYERFFEGDYLTHNFEIDIDAVKIAVKRMVPGMQKYGYYGWRVHSNCRIMVEVPA